MIFSKFRIVASIMIYITVISKVLLIPVIMSPFPKGIQGGLDVTSIHNFAKLCHALYYITKVLIGSVESLELGVQEYTFGVKWVSKSF